MKVSIRITVDIDPDAWANEYCIDRSEVRDDVKRYAQNAVFEQIQGLGLLRDKD